ncbi:MAG: hypothetical protein LQ337_005968 [Flavoplaca oasis]|nr:MAG: hypothetical protein LQ337_005968 [Flavoplaca oasis]
MIRLLDAESQTLHDFKDEDRPPYAILSHRWAKDPSEEVVFNDMPQFQELSSSRGWKKADSAAKLIGACQMVLETTIQDDVRPKYLWIDTVCIKQDSQMELSTAINSMFRIYQEAHFCLVYLADYPTADVQTIGQSDWFNRGWTLQELLAPTVVNFFDKNWKYLGDKKSLDKELARRTGIQSLYLQDIDFTASVSQRMSWMAGRTVTVPEDAAYCLLGIFGVNMPLIYGEGKERAFLRLQEEIMKYSDDHTLFAWTTEYQPPKGTIVQNTGLLAPSPDCFRSTGHYRRYEDWKNNKPYQMTNKGIAIDFRLRKMRDDDNNLPGNRYVAPLNCRHCDKMESVGIYLELKPGNRYCRVRPDELAPLDEPHRGELQSIYVKESDGIPLLGLKEHDDVTGEKINIFKAHALFNIDGTERPNGEANWESIRFLMVEEEKKKARRASRRYKVQ